MSVDLSVRMLLPVVFFIALTGSHLFVIGLLIGVFSPVWNALKMRLLCLWVTLNTSPVLERNYA